MNESNNSGAAKFTLKAKEFEKTNVPASEPTDVPTSVYQILEDNKRKAAEVERPLEFQPRPNQRRRDYLIIMFIGNGLIGLALFLLPKNLLVTAFSVAAILVFSLVVTWVMYGVMDRY